MIKKYTVLAILLIFVSFDHPVQKEKYTLTIKVGELRNSQGLVLFTLYNKEGSIPDEQFRAYYKQQSADINNDRSFTSFKDLPKGRYAINILHDENKNGKIDKKFILPVEGVGFSNFTNIGLTDRPNFTKASFKVQADTTVAVKIIYK